MSHETAEERAARFGRGFGLAVAAIGASAFVGWLTGLRLLTSVRPSFIPVAPNTALALLALGLGLAATLAVRQGRVAPAWVGRVGAGLVTMVAALRLSEYITGVDLGIDRLIIAVHAERHGLAPVGKMALPTAAGLLMASLALSLRAWSRGLGDAVGSLACLVGVEGLVFSLGYAYDPSSPLMSDGPSIPMALPTAVGLLLMGLGLIAAAGPGALPLKAMAGGSVRARLLRSFVPFGAAVVIVAIGGALAISGSATSRRYAALLSAVSAVAAAAMAGAIGARIARKVGGDLERAEEALRRAHDEMEAKVVERTRELLRSKTLVEERNQQLQQLASDLEETTESVRRAHRELQQAEAQLVQSEKLASLGQMVAGVAHEINNPLAFVNNNLVVLQREVGCMHELIRLYSQAETTLDEQRQDLLARIREYADEIDLSYVLENLDGLMTRTRDGLKRIQQIVKNLRDFARLDEGEFKEANLNDGIVSTIQIARGQAETRGVAIEMDLAPLPEIPCYPAKLNQVVLNLLSNAIDACNPGGRVGVRTREDAGALEIHVEDNGRGIDPCIHAKVFDPFFTTKPIGQGTGLGLSISFGIVQAHGGTIVFDSEPGRGTRFVVRLPKSPPPPTGRGDRGRVAQAS